jgi:tetratricopeptide (TPR) repeat protein
MAYRSPRPLPAVFLVLTALLTPPAFSQQREPNWPESCDRTAVLLEQGRTGEAVKLLEEAIATARRSGPVTVSVAEALNDLGALYYDSGRFTEAERAYSEAISFWKNSPQTSPKLATLLGNLAALRLLKGQLSEAEKRYSQAERALSSAGMAESPEMAAVLCGQADVYRETRRYEAAKHSLLGRALILLERDARNPQLGVALYLLARIAWNEHRVPEAERLLRRAIECGGIPSGHDIQPTPDTSKLQAPNGKREN